MAKVRHELAGMLREGLGIVGGGLSIVRQVSAAMGSDVPPVAAELEGVCEAVSHVAGKLDEWTDKDEDAFLGKAVKASVNTVTDGAKRERMKRAKKTSARMRG